MPDMDFVLTLIDGLVRGGQHPNAVYEFLKPRFGAELVRAAMTAFEERTGRIRMLRDPSSLIDSTTRVTWYSGPKPHDIFWPRFRELLESKAWPEKAINAVDNASSKIVSLLSPPGQPGKTKGLVLGYVQSGKTTNFTAVIAKAADAGYKFFVILSGMHNGLRNQTQHRLARELQQVQPQAWHLLTQDKTDFSAASAMGAEAFLTSQSPQKVLCVMKKNGAVLGRFSRWLKDTDQNVLSQCPVLLIDDEADQAGLNASPDPQAKSKVHARLIEIIGRLPSVAYVGYTATPFANVLIDINSPDDLYPQDFIVDLPRPVDYFGAETLFGRDRLTADDSETRFDGLDMIRRVTDADVPFLRPASNADARVFLARMPQSLQDALRYFWMATAARWVRGDFNKHSSMLVHTTLYADIHPQITGLVTRYKDEVSDSLGSREFLALLKTQWDNECDAVSAAALGESPVSFEALSANLPSVLRATTSVTENSRSMVRLEYGDTPSVQIVIGGNTLSRGLTIEGLVVSYFVRTASAYDTLLQMGRWFGFRPNYADLPRVWMTSELEENYFDLATVEQEIRNDIKRYELEHLTPRQLQVRIRTHPALEVTNRLKMRAAIACSVSYSDRMVQTTCFAHTNAEIVMCNRDAIRRCVTGALESGGRLVTRPDHTRFEAVDVQIVMRLIEEYRFHERNIELKQNLLKEYIRAQNGEGDLLRWNIAVVGLARGGDERKVTLAADLTVPLLTRSRRRVGDEAYASLGATIASKEDRVIDMDLPASQKTGTPAELQRMRRQDIGLLLVYPIDKDSSPRAGARLREPLNAVGDLYGLAFVFPKARKDSPQQYVSAPPADTVEELEPFQDDEDNA